MADLVAFASSYDETPYLRVLTQVTFIHKSDALAAVRELRRQSFPVDFPTISPSPRVKIRLKFCQETDYRKDLQEKLLERHQEDMQRWNPSPDMRRIRAMVLSKIHHLLPIYFDPNNFY